ncbi:TetR/AcrR family transcriptional regulator C-terminal domain-containing protein [Umezawaea sp. Da 62-37]|uniref:TetR/AcrR family transcriptional regulator C-terminal domain-containing protein n=1 Tax=Umezawaea sp. Da 62-37 TaxID=3075927 RepID=UPI0028F72093|nr:TetR/AcrR family transcriptional regulator C-terminal domain-containing protein [Umezawaea sp. Da 62-37]WNV89958.1 TetR/AcrR family transcriptional regulator C-terminal domain-containing protein [Umezawaea sp. Da 62-37]
MSRRDEVLQAALDLLDEVGLDDLTTRKLADRLGVQVGALYRHFTSKRALLDAMVDAIATGGPTRSLPEGDWADRLTAMAIGMRSAMLTRRDGARLVATMSTPGPEAAAQFAGTIGVLVHGGAPPEIAALATDTVFAYVNGFTIEEQARKTGRVPREQLDREFEAGLGLIIAGVRTAF